MEQAFVEGGRASTKWKEPGIPFSGRVVRAWAETGIFGGWKTRTGVSKVCSHEVNSLCAGHATRHTEIFERRAFTWKTSLRQPDMNAPSR